MRDARSLYDGDKCDTCEYQEWVGTYPPCETCYDASEWSIHKADYRANVRKKLAQAMRKMRKAMYAATDGGFIYGVDMALETLREFAKEL